MKSLLKSAILIAFVFAVMAGSASIEAAGSKITGTWDYSAPYAPYEYSEGLISIEDNAGELEGKVSIDGYDMKLNKVKYEEDVLSFSLYVEGEYVSVNLTIKNDTFSGEADTPEGIIEITGEKAE